MNQQYRDNFENIQDRDSSNASPSGVDGSGLSDEIDNPRGITFVLANANTKTLFYSYLIAIDFAAESGTIMLEFTSHVVKLQGVNLRILLEQLITQRVSVIRYSDARYNLLDAENTCQVNSIDVEAAG